MPKKLWLYGIALGIGASIGSYIGKKLLGKMQPETFRRWVVALMVISGVMLIGRVLY